MNNPQHFSGMQHVERGPVEPGDYYSFESECGGRELELIPDAYHGAPVWLLNGIGFCVYRKVPVAKQGGAGVTAQGNPVPSLSDPQSRKRIPVASGVIDYFPDAIMEVANVSFVGNEQHHPGQPLHWDRSKSTDEADALMRHFVQRGTRDADGLRHTAKVAWRALALLQKEIEASRVNRPTGGHQ
jgi:hypothetical protein